MFMERPSNINKPSIDLSTQIGGAGGAKALQKVSRDGASVGSGKSYEIPGNGARVAGTGKDENAAGQALLMMQGNNILPINGFLKEKDAVGEKPVDIRFHTEALLTDGLAANAKFQELVNLASRDESSSGTVSLHEIERRKQAVMSLDGLDPQLGAALRLALSSADRQGPITTEEIINSFRKSSD